ncbi:MAG: TIR domain-containing protein [Armatimonadota bacterium]
MITGAITIRISHKKALELLSELIDTWPDSEDEYTVWNDRAQNVLAAIYGDQSQALTALSQIRYTPTTFGAPGDGRFQKSHSKGRKQAKDHIVSLRNLLEKCMDASYSTEVSESIGDGSVFIVHGQNHGKLAEVRFLLGQLGIECCVLQDEPNSGQTIIEKFESHGGNASYAIVLLTADDIGGAKQNNEVQSRARQNVIFEFGYFCGKLGRHKTAVLYEPGVEIPSDLRGLAYVELDSSGAWKYRLADELSQAGYPVDKNKIT